MSLLKDKVVLITGGSDGIGKETAILLANAGCKLILVARHEGKLKTLKESLLNGNSSLKIHCVVCDVSKLEGILFLYEYF